MIASSFRYPGNVRTGSCDKSGQCSQDYTVHCQKCFDFCQRQQGPGPYETAVITLGINPNKPNENVQNRPDPGNNEKNLRSAEIKRSGFVEIYLQKNQSIS